MNDFLTLILSNLGTGTLTGFVTYLVTFRANRKIAEADASDRQATADQHWQTVYRDTIADLKTERSELRQEVNGLRKEIETLRNEYNTMLRELGDMRRKVENNEALLAKVPAVVCALSDTCELCKPIVIKNQNNL